MRSVTSVILKLKGRMLQQVRQAAPGQFGIKMRNLNTAVDFSQKQCLA